MLHLLEGEVATSIFVILQMKLSLLPHLLIFYMAVPQFVCPSIIKRHLCCFVVSFSLIYALNALNFPLNTAFAASYNF